MLIPVESQPAEGCAWTAFLLFGESVALPMDAQGQYVSDSEADKNAVSFPVECVQPGFSLIKFTCVRSEDGDISDQRIYLAHVDADMSLTLQDITESSALEGTVISVNAEEYSATLDTQLVGQVIAQFATGEAVSLPSIDEQVILYTDGIMTMSLPPIVNVLAWDSVPSPKAR